MEPISWEEPRAFKQAWDKKYHPSPYPWWQPVAAIGIAALVLGGFALHNNPIGGSWPLSIALGLGCGLAMAYGLPLLGSLSPRIVTIYENGFGYNQVTGGVRLVRWKWEQIRYFSLQTMSFDGRDYTVLGAHYTDNTWLGFALSSKVTPEAIEAYLHAHGKDLQRRTTTG